MSPPPGAYDARTLRRPAPGLQCVAAVVVRFCSLLALVWALVFRVPSLLMMGTGPAASPLTLDAERRCPKRQKLTATALPSVEAAAHCAEGAGCATHGLLLTECHWYVALAELRKKFCQRWKVTWGRAAPAEAFNAWLLEALSLGEGDLWPPAVDGRAQCSTTASVPSKAIQAWVRLHMPCEWPPADTVPAALDHVRRFASALACPMSPPRWDAVAEADVEAVLGPLKLESCTDPSDVQRLARAALQPLAAAALDPRACAFSAEVHALADEVRARWGELCGQRVQLAAPGKETRLSVLVEALESGEADAAARTRYELSGPLPADLEGKLPRRYEIYTSHAEKLRSLFDSDLAAKDAFALAPLEARCWTLLTRYQALYGPHREGAGWHMALTSPVLESLAQDFGVSHELFASPLNCGLPEYCSVFDDTDRCFGSQGGFFKFCRTALVSNGGSFQCNPPFEEHLLKRVLDVLVGAVTTCTKPLSIAFVLPDWPESGLPALATQSLHCRGSVRISGDRHSYLHGRQHCCHPRRRVVQQEGRGSLVAFLQNDAGAARWPVTQDRLDRHSSAWGRS